MTPAARLSEIAHRQLALAAEQARLEEEAAALLDQLANGDGAAEPVADNPEPEPSSIVPLAEAAQELGIGYDAVRMRATRARAAYRLSDRSYVFRSWLESQKKSKCSVVRSVDVRTEHLGEFAQEVNE